MAQVTAALVKQLREMTGVGMMQCKKALDATDGDLEAAVDWLRKAGLASAEKKAGRATNEGSIQPYISEDGSKAALVELDCETDFVAENEKFQGYAKRIAQAVVENEPADLDELKQSKIDGETVDQYLSHAIQVIDENILMPHFAFLKQTEGVPAMSSYVHGIGHIGVIVSFKLGKKETAASDEFKKYAYDIAMQVAAADPVSARRDMVPQETIDHEMSIYKEQAKNSGKPEAIQEKIATGRLEKFYRENVLTEQEFVKNPDQSVADYTKEVAKSLDDTIEIVDFKRLEVGADE